jgi:hypothetical protein
MNVQPTAHTTAIFSHPKIYFGYINAWRKLVRRRAEADLAVTRKRCCRVLLPHFFGRSQNETATAAIGKEEMHGKKRQVHNVL